MNTTVRFKKQTKKGFWSSFTRSIDITFPFLKEDVVSENSGCNDTFEQRYSVCYDTWLVIRYKTIWAHLEGYDMMRFSD